jgi:Holliday junction resolvase
VVNTARQGAAFERRIIADLKPHGYDCIRSAASKGPVDIVAVAPLVQCACGCGNRDLPDTTLLFIQAKLSKPLISPAERLGIQDLALRAGALPLVSWWAADETTGLMRVHYRQLTGPGPKDWAHWAPGEDN